MVGLDIVRVSQERLSVCMSIAQGFAAGYLVGHCPCASHAVSPLGYLPSAICRLFGCCRFFGLSVSVSGESFVQSLLYRVSMFVGGLGLGRRC